MPTKKMSTSMEDLQAAEGQEKEHVGVGEVADLNDEDDRLLPTQEVKQLAMENVAHTTYDKGASESGGRHAYFSGDNADDGRLQQFVEVEQARAGQTGDAMGIMFINISPQNVEEPMQYADDDSITAQNSPMLGAKSAAMRDKAATRAVKNI